MKLKLPLPLKLLVAIDVQLEMGKPASVEVSTQYVPPAGPFVPLRTIFPPTTPKVVILGIGSAAMEIVPLLFNAEVTHCNPEPGEAGVMELNEPR